jgi:hypothetical protein
MRFDMHNIVLQKPALNPGTINTDATTAGTIIDTDGFEALEFVVQSGTVTAGTFTPLIEHSDNADFSGSSAVDDDDLLGTEADAAFAAADDNEAKRIGYRGEKRYVRLSLVSASSANGVIGALAILGRPYVAKTDAQ